MYVALLRISLVETMKLLLAAPILLKVSHGLYCFEIACKRVYEDHEQL
jgi:hypothetical protein